MTWCCWYCDECSCTPADHARALEIEAQGYERLERRARSEGGFSAAHYWQEHAHAARHDFEPPAFRGLLSDKELAGQ
jgi:hypothetical protein